MTADFSVAQISKMPQMWSLVGTCRASYLVSLFKATWVQKEHTVCLKWHGQSILSGAPGGEYSHYKISAEENRHQKLICVLFLKIISKPWLMYLVLFFLCLPLNMKLSGHRELFDLFSHCVTVVGGPTRRGGEENSSSLLQLPSRKITTSQCVITFCCCCLCCAAGKIPGPPWWGRNNDRIVEQ